MANFLPIPLKYQSHDDQTHHHESRGSPDAHSFKPCALGDRLGPSLPTEVWVIISNETTTLSTLASLTATCHRLYDVAFPLLMHKAAHHRLSNNMTVLHWASANGHIRVIKGLLGVGAAVGSLDQRGFSPLICACEFGREDVIEYLIAHAAVLDINLEMEKALTEAARFNHPGVLKILFRQGTKLNHQDWWTILSAASSGHLEVAKLLLSNGVDANFRLVAARHEIPLCARPYVDRTALYLAVCNQHADMVALLMDSGADIDALNFGSTAIQHLASRWPHLSPAEERCLYELCRRSRWRQMWWKFRRLLQAFMTKIRRRGRRSHSLSPSGFWTRCIIFFFLLGIVGMIVAATANVAAGLSIFGVAFIGFGLSGFMDVQTF